MKYLSAFIAVFLFLANGVYVEGFGLDLGPISVQINQDNPYVQKVIQDNPFCYAISHQKRLALVIESKSNVSDKEFKVVTNKVIVEPYAFGITKDGRPVLNGNIVEEKLIKEVTVKLGEDQVDENASPKEGQPTNVPQKKGFFSGWLSSDKNQISADKNMIDITQIRDLDVVEDSHFDVPKDFKGLDAADVQVLCQLPIAQQQPQNK
jgi:hypothetical protein